ncbi:MAG TPA: hypothetical protein VF173_13995 [Thermoanaerobaculia bacterium]|nr:hypothetical protein [Thermoanaerobaculia bacterium]
MVITIEVLVSFVCLSTLIVILLEASRTGGLRRKLPVAVWAITLLTLAALALLRILVNLGSWTDGRILSASMGSCNFVFGSALLVRWLFWVPPFPAGEAPRGPGEERNPADSRLLGPPLP